MDSLPNIKFSKPAHGWMTVMVGDYQFEVSDVPCDSLYELCKALTLMLNGFPVEPVEWSKEPDYERWLFELNANDCKFSICDVNLRIVESWILPTIPFITLIVRRLEELSVNFESEKNNVEFWSWDFPSDLLKAIKIQLSRLE